jgi:replicative DNA helicase
MSENVVPMKANEPAEQVPAAVPLVSIETEQALLGALLFNNHILPEVAAIVSVEHFSEDVHRRIFSVAAQMIESGQRASPITMPPYLGEHKIGEITLSAYLVRLAANAITVCDAPNFARTVRDLALRRKLAEAGDALATSARGAAIGSNPATLASKAIGELQEVAGAGRAHDTRADVGVSAAALLARAQRIQDGTEKSPAISTGIPDLDHETGGGIQPGDLWLVGGRPGMGKAQPLDALIRTPNGWVTFRDVSAGQEIASIDGAANVVLGKFPQGEKEVFRLRFSDGRSVEACADHLWEVRYREWGVPRIKTTEQLCKMLTRARYQKRLMIRQCNGEFGAEQALPVDPYLLGAILGDGSILYGRVGFTTADKHILDRVEAALPLGMSANFISKLGYNLVSPRGKPNPLTVALRDLGLMGHGAASKFIPKQYFFGSRVQRLELLRGLMDTDGYAGADGVVSFSSCSQVLSLGVQDLARSLGYWAKIARKECFLTVNGVRTQHRDALIVTITGVGISEVFSLPRKVSRCSNRKWNRALTVAEIVPAARKECACIAVGHPSRLYITNDYILTHNSIVATGFCIRIAQREVGVKLFEHEMNEGQTTARFLSDLSYRKDRRIVYRQIVTGDINPTEMWCLEDAQKRLAKMPIVVDYATGLTLPEIAARIRSEKTKMDKDGVKLGVVIIDYLQLVQVAERYRGNRTYELAEITAGLKKLAKDENIGIVALSQLTRASAGYERKDKRPNLTDLRDSGALEADADVVVFIHRESYYLANSPEYRNGDEEAVQKFLDTQNEAELLIAKTRLGATKQVKIWCDVGCSTFAAQARGEGMF